MLDYVMLFMAFLLSSQSVFANSEIDYSKPIEVTVTAMCLNSDKDSVDKKSVSEQWNVFFNDHKMKHQAQVAVTADAKGQAASSNITFVGSRTDIFSQQWIGQLNQNMTTMQTITDCKSRLVSKQVQSL